MAAEASIDTDKRRPEIVRRVRTGLTEIGRNGTQEQLIKFYNDNADDYKEAIEMVNYDEGARALVTALAELLPNKDARILDVAAGSGFVGRELRKQGYDNIDALDPAKNMLDLAKAEGLYRNYIVDSINVNRTNSLKDNIYDGLCIGGTVTLMNGHITVECLPELIRITKKGGIIIFNIADHHRKTPEGFQDDSLAGMFQAFVDNGEWSKWDTFRAPYRDDEDCTIFRIILS
ncbi:methyltransferase-like protein 27 [Amphiura filiformis]|uniref:methyltransferase-like protein 27 n=1 Tax=Amphiura filiformis TaxID=82378 RepID=UPI003B20F908